MKKLFNIIRTSENYGSPLRRRLCVDINVGTEVRQYFKDNQEKFLQLAERILTNHHIYYDYYKQEYRSSNNIKISAIRFLDNQNTRIYCQEISNREGEFFIICAEILSKKTQKNDKKINSVLEKISKYEYQHKP